MYNCLIVDDEPNAHAVLKHYIAMDTELNIAGQAYNAIEAQSYLDTKNIDIVFLDINMPEITGLQMLKQKNIKASIILTTAYSDYALDGFELGVTDYLLKPIPLNRFINAIQKAKKILLVENLDKFIYFKINGMNMKILYSDILYFESVGNYIKIHTIQKKHLTIGTLSDLENTLNEQDFLRIHKSYIVNNKFLKNTSNKTSITINENTIPIGRTYKGTVVKFMEE